MSESARSSVASPNYCVTCGLPFVDRAALHEHWNSQHSGHDELQNQFSSVGEPMDNIPATTATSDSGHTGPMRATTMAETEAQLLAQLSGAAGLRDLRGRPPEFAGTLLMMQAGDGAAGGLAQRLTAFHSVNGGGSQAATPFAPLQQPPAHDLRNPTAAGLGMNQSPVLNPAQLLQQQYFIQQLVQAAVANPIVLNQIAALTAGLVPGGLQAPPLLSAYPATYMFSTPGAGLNLAAAAAAAGIPPHTATTAGDLPQNILSNGVFPGAAPGYAANQGNSSAAGNDTPPATLNLFRSNLLSRAYLSGLQQGSQSRDPSNTQLPSAAAAAYFAAFGGQPSTTSVGATTTANNIGAFSGLAGVHDAAANELFSKTLLASSLSAGAAAAFDLRRSAAEFQLQNGGVMADCFGAAAAAEQMAQSLHRSKLSSLSRQGSLETQFPAAREHSTAASPVLHAGVGSSNPSAASGASSCSGGPGTPSSCPTSAINGGRSLSSVLNSPKAVEQHIQKLISENEALLQTPPVMLKKRHSRASGASNSISGASPVGHSGSASHSPAGHSLQSQGRAARSQSLLDPSSLAAAAHRLSNNNAPAAPVPHVSPLARCEQQPLQQQHESATHSSTNSSRVLSQSLNQAQLKFLSEDMDHEETLTYTCKFCPNTFRNSESLKAHEFRCARKDIVSPGSAHSFPRLDIDAVSLLKSAPHAADLMAAADIRTSGSLPSIISVGSGRIFTVSSPVQDAAGASTNNKHPLKKRILAAAESDASMTSSPSPASPSSTGTPARNLVHQNSGEALAATVISSVVEHASAVPARGSATSAVVSFASAFGSETTGVVSPLPTGALSLTTTSGVGELAVFQPYDLTLASKIAGACRSELSGGGSGLSWQPQTLPYVARENSSANRRSRSKSHRKTGVTQCFPQPLPCPVLTSSIFGTTYSSYDQAAHKARSTVVEAKMLQKLLGCYRFRKVDSSVVANLSPGLTYVLAQDEKTHTTLAPSLSISKAICNLSIVSAPTNESGALSTATSIDEDEEDNVEDDVLHVAATEKALETPTNKDQEQQHSKVNNSQSKLTSLPKQDSTEDRQRVPPDPLPSVCCANVGGAPSVSSNRSSVTGPLNIKARPPSDPTPPVGEHHQQPKIVGNSTSVSVITTTNAPVGNFKERLLESIACKDQQEMITARKIPVCNGGYKSTEAYTYIKGRGRGRYVCERCGIRCKKPSMLKKHIRTHLNIRPYTCRKCKFSFKTKGNLTKHLKSKSHSRKCQLQQTTDIFGLKNNSSDASMNFATRKSSLDKSKRLSFSSSDVEDYDEDDECLSDVESESERSAASFRTERNANLPESLLKGKFRSAWIESLPERSIRTPPAWFLHYATQSEEQPERCDSAPAELDFEFPATNSCDCGNDHQCSTAMPAAAFEESSTNSNAGTTLHDDDVISKTANERVVFAQAVQHVAAENTALLRRAVLQEAVALAGFGTNVQLSPPKLLQGSTVQMPQAVFINSHHHPAPYNVGAEGEGPTKCPSCGKEFSKVGMLRLHMNVHIFEQSGRRYEHKCPHCPTVLRSKKKLERHLLSHRTTAAATNHCAAAAQQLPGTASVDLEENVSISEEFSPVKSQPDANKNPRPFECVDCNIAFRIRGHLAKHLRSKLHIMKLECLGKLPIGTYAKLEGSDGRLADIEANDCESFMNNLAVIAKRLLTDEDQSDLLIKPPIFSADYTPVAQQQRRPSTATTTCTTSVESRTIPTSPTFVPVPRTPTPSRQSSVAASDVSSSDEFVEDRLVIVESSSAEGPEIASSSCCSGSTVTSCSRGALLLTCTETLSASPDLLCFPRPPNVENVWQMDVVCEEKLVATAGVGKVTMASNNSVQYATANNSSRRNTSASSAVKADVWVPPTSTLADLTASKCGNGNVSGAPADLNLSKSEHREDVMKGSEVTPSSDKTVIGVPAVGLMPVSLDECAVTKAATDLASVKLKEQTLQDGTAPASKSPKCRFCGDLEFPCVEELEVHLYSDHIVRRDGTGYLCPRCDGEKVIFPTRENLRAHISAHFYNRLGNSCAALKKHSEEHGSSMFSSMELCFPQSPFTSYEKLRNSSTSSDSRRDSLISNGSSTISESSVSSSVHSGSQQEPTTASGTALATSNGPKRMKTHLVKLNSIVEVHAQSAGKDNNTGAPAAASPASVDDSEETSLQSLPSQQSTPSGECCSSNGSSPVDNNSTQHPNMATSHHQGKNSTVTQQRRRLANSAMNLKRKSLDELLCASSSSCSADGGKRRPATMDAGQRRHSNAGWFPASQLLHSQNLFLSRNSNNNQFSPQYSTGAHNSVLFENGAGFWLSDRAAVPVAQLSSIQVDQLLLQQALLQQQHQLPGASTSAATAFDVAALTQQILAGRQFGGFLSNQPTPELLLASANQASSAQFTCSLCSKRLANQAALQEHMMTHVAPRPFICDHCDAGFTNASALKNHLAKH